MEHHLTRVRQIYVSMAKAAQGQQDADTLTISQVRAELQASKAATLDAQGKLAQIVEESEARVQSAESAMVLALMRNPKKRYCSCRVPCVKLRNHGSSRLDLPPWPKGLYRKQR